MGGRSSGSFSKGGGGSALTSGEKDSIFDYTTSRFQSINGLRRKGDERRRQEDVRRT